MNRRDSSTTQDKTVTVATAVPQRRGVGTYAAMAIVFDLLGTLAALFFAWQLRVILPFGQPNPGSIEIPSPDGRSTLVVPGPLEIPPLVVGIILAVWGVLFVLLSVYDSRKTRPAWEQSQRVLVAVSLSLFVLAGALYFSYRTLSRLLFVYFYVLDLALLLGWRTLARLVTRFLRGKWSDLRRVVIVGAGKLGLEVAEMLRQHSWSGLQVVGFLDDERTGSLAGLPILGALNKSQRVVVEGNIQEVVIALPYEAYEGLNQVVAALQALPVQIRIVPDYFSLALYRATVEDFGGLPLISLRDPAMTRSQRVLKRAFDLLLTPIFLLFALPIMPIIAVAIKRDSAGPVIFKQQRVGESGRLFTMYKFRSMRLDAEEHQVLQYDADGNLIHKIADDPRVTRLGRFLRRTSLDELPQLFNVLKGDMSLVGPRPELPWLVERYAHWQRKRFAVPQGLTGWWQINERSSRPMHVHTEDDLYYIQNYSLWLDLQILWKTVPAVLKRRGAF